MLGNQSKGKGGWGTKTQTWKWTDPETDSQMDMSTYRVSLEVPCYIKYQYLKIIFNWFKIALVVLWINAIHPYFLFAMVYCGRFTAWTDAGQPFLWPKQKWVGKYHRHYYMHKNVLYIRKELTFKVFYFHSLYEFKVLPLPCAPIIKCTKLNTMCRSAHCT